MGVLAFQIKYILSIIGICLVVVGRHKNKGWKSGIEGHWKQRIYSKERKTGGIGGNQGSGRNRDMIKIKVHRWHRSLHAVLLQKKVKVSSGHRLNVTLGLGVFVQKIYEKGKTCDLSVNRSRGIGETGVVLIFQ